MLKNSTCPKLGPEPTLLTRKEIDALYDTLDTIRNALETLNVDYIVTGGSLLGSIRQHSILFCDDDIDIAIIDKRLEFDEKNKKYITSYDRVSQNLSKILGDNFTYQVRPWEGGDKVRPKRFNNVFVDIFTLRRFDSMDDFISLIGVKKNGEPQRHEYVQGIVNDIQEHAFSQNEENLYGKKSLCPFWHFNTRKAIEMWRKEVYRDDELFPLSGNLKFGPLIHIKGPRMPVLLLKRAFGMDCFDVYYQSGSHTKGVSKVAKRRAVNHVKKEAEASDISNLPDQILQKNLKPKILEGGNWENSKKMILEEEHYLPIQPISRAKRRPTLHNRAKLFEYLKEQEKQEQDWMTSYESLLRRKETNLDKRPNRTVYMDGVFDLFHIGHVEAINQCARLGNRVIIGITGDSDAADYKRPPIISQDNRIAVVRALKHVDQIVCPCPLVVTEEFMNKYAIDLVVHGFFNDEDAKQQYKFFEIPIKLGKFQRIPYYEDLSTTDIIRKIKKFY